MINMANEKKYKFSVVTAVYNIEQFLEEAIESVINQDIGFEENVQLILVDDGATDKSGEICDRYYKKYPENIVVIHKENGGASSARNEGLKHVKGEYVNFLDGDDKLSEDALRMVYKQFGAWKEKVDLITIPVCFFDAEKGEHVLNNKFAEGTRIIDLEEEYDKPLLSVSASFIKREVIQKYCFDEQLAYAEDGKVVIQILLERKKYGVVKETKYLYRKRGGGEESAIQYSLKNKKWYLDYIKGFALWALLYVKEIEKEIPLFVQFTIMYDLQWRFRTPVSPETVLTEEECQEYYGLLKQALQLIEDEIIISQKYLTIEYKLYVLRFKHGRMPEYEYQGNDIRYFYDNVTISWESWYATKIEFIKFEKEAVEIEGKMSFPNHSCEDDIKIYVKLNEKLIECEKVKRNDNMMSMGKNISFEIGFKVNLIPDPKIENKISFLCEINGLLVQKKEFSFGKFSPLQNHMWNSYFVSKPYILTYLEGTIFLKPYTLFNHMYREGSFLKGLLKLRSKPAYKAVVMRTLCHIYKLFPHKDVWLLSDRINKADDNGEALFEYLNQKKPQNLRYYFAISKESPDYERLKNSGKVIEFLGWKYKWLCLCGAKVISSQGEDYVYHPFAEYSYCYADLMQKSRFVFLQHGVTKDDLSRWLRRFNKNIHMFVTTTIPEYNSIINGKYGYGADVVKLTGFSRYDRLYHDEKRYITIMPSWRAYLVSDTDVHTGKRNVRNGFLTSQYCTMYSELLMNEELLSYAGEHGYTIRFMSHPNMSACTELLSIDSRVEVLQGENIVYRELFAESDLIITDYSSIAFDFAYLRKPILYFQADKDEFFSGSHTYDKGYFEYEEDGFGEVAYDIETLINLMKEYIDTDCKLKERYLKRINETFPYSDRNNSQRVYDAICDLK